MASDRFGSDRFAGLVGAYPGWRQEPGWRGAGSYRNPSDWRDVDRGGRSGYRPGSSGGWRSPSRNVREVRGGTRRARTGETPSGGQSEAPPEGYPGGPAGAGSGRTLPGERFASPPGAPESSLAGAPFRAGEIADRGPLERGAVAAPEPRARDLRELERQRSWAVQANRALNEYRADEVDEEPETEARTDGAEKASATPRPATPPRGAGAAASIADEAWDEDDEAVADEVRDRAAIDAEQDEGGPVLRVRDDTILPTLRVLPHGISRKRLEQAIKELQLPVIVARDPDESDVVMTLKSEYRQKTSALREAENRGLPIYVLKSNTIAQMEASLTSIFSLEVDPREAALRETEEAIGLVMERSEPVELSPQNAYIRRLQHQMAERANVISRSRGREPYRRVRLYP